ncbi:MAG: putative glycoside hydrolase, partial [Actinomycetota bacterium]
DDDGDGDEPTDDPVDDEATEAEADGDADEGAGSGVQGTVVSGDDGGPLADVVITFGDQTVTTGADGSFALVPGNGDQLLIRRPTFQPVAVPIDDLDPDQADGVEITLEPVLSRGVRVSREVAADPQRYRELLTQIGPTSVNSLVFDTKDETGQVLYETDVELAEQLGAVEALYDPEDLLADAIEAGLYPITRVVTFEDKIWSAADAEAKLAGAWVDATNQDNWEYPLDLAEEACRIGFAEIQFDYVRYPAGRTAEVAASQVPATSAERADVIASFLAEAKTRLEPMGCGVSAAIFGIVMSSETDEGIGQTVEAVSAQVDAVSPMLYPSHYGPGWLGFADPNDHPGPVIADALEDGIPKLSEPIQMRPWIQAFYYNGAQIGAQITEAESRGAGWLLWNASGRYRDDWLPAGP